MATSPSVPSSVARPARKPVAKAAAEAVMAVNAPRAAELAKPQKAEKAPKAARPAKAEKLDKPRKPKLVRDSFTIPKDEYEVIALLKARAAKAGAPAKKSELLRAGIKLLAGLDAAAFAAALKAVPAVKTGRPAKD